MKILDWIEEIVCIVCTVVMTALVFGNVLSRYIFHSSMAFSEEITTYLFILLSMMGTAIAAKRRAHLGLSIITDAASPKTRRALNVLGYSIATLFSAALLYYGVLMVFNQYRLGMVTPAMQWPEWIYATFVPFGAVFVTIRFAQATWEEAHVNIDETPSETPAKEKEE